MNRILTALLVAAVARADVPSQLSYTGTLMDQDGSLVEDGTYAITLSFYGVATGGVRLWTEPLTVSTDGGVFTALLGAQAVPLQASLFAQPQLWLEIKVEDDVLSPRLQVVSVPYAMAAASAGSADTLDCVDCVDSRQIDDSVMQRRILGMCTGNEAVVSINEDGSVNCAPGVTLAGTGLATTGAKSDHHHMGTYLPLGGAMGCPGSQKVFAIDAFSGNVQCSDDIDTDTDTTYSAGTGIEIVDTTISTSFTGFACTDTDKLSGFDALGFPVCKPDARVVDTHQPRQNPVAVPDSVGSGGRYVSATIGVDGLPVIAHHDALGGDLRVLKCGSPSCQAGNSATIVDPGLAGSAGEFASIAIGTDGLPIISYYDAANGDLRVAHCGDPACSSGNTRTTLDGAAEDVGRHTSITVGTDGLPVVSYRDVTNLSLKVAKCTDGACAGFATLATVDTGNVGEFTSIAIGADGHPVMSYYDVGNDDLKVAWCGDSACSAGNAATTVDGGRQDLGRYSSLTIGADGLPVVAHYDNTRGNLRVVKCADVTCSSVSAVDVDTSAEVGPHASISIGADGLPVVAYHDAANGTLLFARCGDAGCSSANVIHTLDDDAVAGHYASVTIGADGLPLIAYRDVSGDRLRVVKCANAFCVPNWTRR